jgi:two-component system CitB family sensor kinase
LPLSRELARRRGGDVWLIESGRPDAGHADSTAVPAASGAVFGARLCDVLETALLETAPLQTAPLQTRLPETTPPETVSLQTTPPETASPAKDDTP